jgi:hypothetical protein
VVLKPEFNLQAAFQIPTCIFALGCRGRTPERYGLLDLQEFRSQRQKFRFRGQLAWIFGVEDNAREVMANARAGRFTLGVWGHLRCTMCLANRVQVSWNRSSPISVSRCA